MNYPEVLAALGCPDPAPNIQQLIDDGLVVKDRNFSTGGGLHLVSGNPYAVTGPLSARAEGGVIRLFVAGIRGPQPFGRHPADAALIAEINARAFKGALLQSPDALVTPHYSLTVLGGRRTELAQLLSSK